MGRRRLLECSFLIPLRRDKGLSDGKRHRSGTWKWLEQRLMDFGGATLATEAYAGWYSDPDTGKRVDDFSRKYFVAIPSEEIAHLRSILQEACVEFQQKCIYLSVAGNVEFVENPRHEIG